jgi:XTP/dITP diphosphohydrolase
MLFVTSNPGKAREAEEILGENVERVDYDYAEIQSGSLVEIAEEGVRDAYGEFGEPCFVDDSGLFIEGVGGFPGPYSSYVYSTLGVNGVLRAIEDVEDRSARFDCAVAYHDGEDVRTFEGTVAGRIAQEPRGDGGFGYDPVFEVKDDDQGRTFAEMSPEEKNAVSHRRRAFESFADRYQQD